MQSDNKRGCCKLKTCGNPGSRSDPNFPVFMRKSHENAPQERGKGNFQGAGARKCNSPFYIFTLVFHDQSHSIDEQIKHLERGLSDIGFESRHCFHAGPIIRREEDYQNLSVAERRKCLNRILTFAKNADISYITFSVEKKHLSDSLQLAVALTKKLSSSSLTDMTHLWSSSLRNRIWVRGRSADPSENSISYIYCRDRRPGIYPRLSHVDKSITF